jgi:hypothetical protein
LQVPQNFFVNVCPGQQLVRARGVVVVVVVVVVVTAAGVVAAAAAAAAAAAVSGVQPTASGHHATKLLACVCSADPRRGPGALQAGLHAGEI